LTSRLRRAGLALLSERYVFAFARAFRRRVNGAGREGLVSSSQWISSSPSGWRSFAGQALIDGAGSTDVGFLDNYISLGTFKALNFT